MSSREEHKRLFPGRPPRTFKARIVSTQITQEQADWLKVVGNGSVSAALRNLIEGAMQESYDVITKTKEST